LEIKGKRIFSQATISSLDASLGRVEINNPWDVMKKRASRAHSLILGRGPRLALLERYIEDDLRSCGAGV
jgi:hypothetical protein